MQSLINETKSNDESSKAASVIKEIQTKETEPTKNKKKYQGPSTSFYIDLS